MLILADSKLCKFLMRLPHWVCCIESARVGYNTTSFVIVSRPYWLRK